MMQAVLHLIAHLVADVDNSPVIDTHSGRSLLVIVLIAVVLVAFAAVMWFLRRRPKR